MASPNNSMDPTKIEDQLSDDTQSSESDNSSKSLSIPHSPHPSNKHDVSKKNPKRLNSSESVNITVASSDTDSCTEDGSRLPYEKISKRSIKSQYLSKSCIIFTIVVLASASVGVYLGFKVGKNSGASSLPQSSLSDPTKQATIISNGTTIITTITPSTITSRATLTPTKFPSNQPSVRPTRMPTMSPSRQPSVSPTNAPVNPILPGQFYFSDIESGPLVGHTTPFSTSIWAFHGKGKTMELVYYRYGDSSTSTTTTTNTISMEPRPDSNNAALVTIDNLVENTHYVYELYVANSTVLVARGQFKTAPMELKPGKFEYLLTSCMNIEAHKGYPDQPVWDHVLDKNPDFAVMAGDTVYLTQQDWTRDTREVIYDRVWYRNMKQRNEPHFAKVIGSVPTYAAWDDHEYGSNNAEKNQPGKENSLKAFRDVWANPSYGTPEVRGNFYSYYWGDVHFIVLDNRWYRDRNQQTQLGADQKLWLYNQLEVSLGTFKVIVNGCDIMEAGYSRDVDDIGKFVSQYRISGVIFNAGDIHRNEFKQQDNGNWPYKITQYTSSGIARDNWMRPWSIIKVNTELNDPEITAHFYGADSKDLDTTWSNDPNLRCRNVKKGDRWGEARCTETIRLSDLTPK